MANLMRYQYLLITFVFIILAIGAQRATRIKSAPCGTISDMTMMRQGFASGRAEQSTQYVSANASEIAPGAESSTIMQMQSVLGTNDRQETATSPHKQPDESYTEGQTQVAYDAEALVGFYQKMVEIRLFEDASTRAFRQGKIGGYLHVYSGQEAVATSFIDAMKDGDITITAYRDHAHALLQGADPNRIMAELYGKGTGIVKGKGGSMHLFHTEGGMYGGYGIVGGHIPLGPGMAYGKRYQGSDAVVQLYFGDGSMNQGAFHEAANLAGLWGQEGLCPCLFILENNQYGMGTSVERSSANTDLGSRFDSYSIEWERVDGMDIQAVLAVAKKAQEYVRETGKPYGIEAFSYRIVPHGAADFLEQYRSKEEVAKWREKDPIPLLHKQLIEMGIEEERLEAIRAEAKAMAEEAVKFAEASPDPDLSELLTDVYADDTYVEPAG